jgi:hypothetical protein
MNETGSRAHRMRRPSPIALGSQKRTVAERPGREK